MVTKKEELVFRILGMFQEKVMEVENQVRAGNYSYAHSVGISANQQLEYLLSVLGMCRADLD